jgi:hypothetical protein
MLVNGYKWEQKMAAVEDMLECPSLPKDFLWTAPPLTAYCYCTRFGFLAKM